MSVTLPQLKQKLFKKTGSCYERKMIFPHCLNGIGNYFFYYYLGFSFLAYITKLHFSSENLTVM